ncbi:MAG: hypothetical protein U0Q18_04610 [Bryobacteraceae bacterium]
MVHRLLHFVLHPWVLARAAIVDGVIFATAQWNILDTIWASAGVTTSWLLYGSAA